MATEIKHEAMKRWRETIQAWYYRVHRGTFCVPPVYMYRVPYQTSTFAGQPLLVPAPFATAGQSQKSPQVSAPAPTVGERHASLVKPASLDTSCRPQESSLSGHGDTTDEQQQPSTSSYLMSLATPSLSESCVPWTEFHTHAGPLLEVRNSDLPRDMPSSSMREVNDVSSSGRPQADSPCRNEPPGDRSDMSDVGSSKQTQADVENEPHELLLGSRSEVKRDADSSVHPQADPGNELYELQLGSRSIKHGHDRVSIQPHTEWQNEPQQSRCDVQNDACPDTQTQCMSTPDTGPVVSVTRSQGKQEASPHSLWPSHVNLQMCRIPVYHSDHCDDLALQHVLHCLQHYGETRGHVMCLLSQLRFQDYLTHPSEAESSQHFARIQDLNKEYSRGNFDILIIHRHYGIVVGEIKAVGKCKERLEDGQAKTEAALKKRLTRAVKQLDKSETVVRHVVKDLAPDIALHKVLILPYVHTTHLVSVLRSYPALLQAMCKCFGVGTLEQVTAQCLCADYLSCPATPWLVTPQVLSLLDEWWKHLSSPASYLSDSVYLDVIARFAGPATTASLHCPLGSGTEVRTLGEAVAETGNRMTYLVLTPSQLEVLYEGSGMVCLTGPPGTGKSVALVLMGLRWLWQGVDVNVVSTWTGSLAACTMIYQQLTLTPRPYDGIHGHVRFHTYDLYTRPQDVEIAARDLADLVSEDGTLCVLMDEILLVNRKLAPLYNQMVQLLSQSDKVCTLYLWATSVGKENIPPALSPRTFSTPLRCPPAVMREVVEGVRYHTTLIHPYDLNHSVPPCDGPKVMTLHHRGEGHEGSWPVECYACGCNVANVLKELQIVERPRDTAQHHATGLCYSDVLVLTRHLALTDEVTGPSGHTVTQASNFVRGLRSREIPVAVIPWSTDNNNTYKRTQLLMEVVAGIPDQVTVADYSSVRGLERKVVVVLPGRWTGVDDKRSDEEVTANERLHAMSRSTALLLLVK